MSDPYLIGWSTVFLSFTFFWLLSRFCSKLPIPKAVRNRRDTFTLFRWRNIMVSLLHAVIIGVWSSLCWVVYFPLIWNDMVFYSNIFIHCLCCFSIGYFLFDAFDIISHRYASRKVDVLFHHLVVTTSASYVVQTSVCSSYLLCGLLAEVNSIFLHSRKLLQLSGHARQSLITRINIFFNFLTHAIFRLGPTSVLLRGVFKDGGRPPFLIACYGIGCIFALSILNVVMLGQLIRADFCRRSNDINLHIKKEKFTEFLNDDWSLNNQQRVGNGALVCDKSS